MWETILVDNPAKEEVLAILTKVSCHSDEAALVTAAVSDHLDAAWNGSTPQRDAFAHELGQILDGMLHTQGRLRDIVADAYVREPYEIEKLVWVEQ